MVIVSPANVLRKADGTTQTLGLAKERLSATQHRLVHITLEGNAGHARAPCNQLVMKRHRRAGGRLIH
jgi:hypothetical protein